MKTIKIEKYHREDYGWIDGLNKDNAEKWVLANYPNAYNIDTSWYKCVTFNYIEEVPWKLEGEELQESLISWGRVLHSTEVIGSSSFTYFDDDNKRHTINTTNYRTARSKTTYFVKFGGELVPFELKDLELSLGWNEAVGFNKWCNENNIEQKKG